jgi:uroporphyrinogen decarboxylase
MTHRERVLAAVGHKESDRVPVDVGGCGTTGLVHACHDALCRHLGIETDGHPPLFARRFDVVVPDERLLRRLDVDCRCLNLGAPDSGAERVEADGAVLVDEFDVRWERPPGGHYIAVEGPLQRIADPTEADLKALRWPHADDPGRYRTFRQRARDLHANTDYAVVFSAGPGPVHVGQWMRGYAEWLVDLYDRPGFLIEMSERVAEYWIETTKRALTEAAEFIDVVMFGDDVGTQNTPVMRPEMYRQFIKPLHRRMVESVKAFGKPVLYHSCGCVYSLIPDFIDVGFDGLNPVQVSARHMDPARLKREFGKELAFWGGIDTQAVLPRGTPDDVCAEVRHRIDELGKDGGYIVSAVHNLQPDVPPENIVAMVETAIGGGAGGLAAGLSNLREPSESD